MTGMTLKQLKRTMTIHDKIEFSYREIPYDFQKEDVGDLVNAKIFPDGRSIAEAQAEIEL